MKPVKIIYIPSFGWKKCIYQVKKKIAVMVSVIMNSVIFLNDMILNVIKNEFQLKRDNCHSVCHHGNCYVENIK